MRLKYKIKRNFIVKNSLISDQSILPSKTYGFMLVRNTLH